MTDYPAAVYAPRTKTNIAGVTYDPAKENIGYAEDFTLFEAEVLAMIADLVGTGIAGGVKGAYPSLAVRLLHLVVGPNSATDGVVPAFDGTTGKLIKDTAITADNIVQGPASATDNAIARFDGATGKLIQNSGAILDDSNNLSIASLKASGANQLKIYNYKKTLTPTDISNGFTSITITAVTRENVILFAVTSYDVDGVNWAAGYGATDTGGKVTGRLTTTTNVNVLLGTDYAANDVVMVTIIEAI